MFSSRVARFATTHRHEVMARCSLLYDQMANNSAVGVASSFQLRSAFGIELELCLDVEAFGFLLDRVGQVALAPWVDLTHFSAQRSDERANTSGGLFAFFRAGSAA